MRPPPPPPATCTVCAHPHRAAIEEKLLARDEDGTNCFGGEAVAAWMAAEGLAPYMTGRTLNRHRAKHLRLSEHVAARAVAAAKAKAAGKPAPEPEPLSPALEAAILVDGANIAFLDGWAEDLTAYRRSLIKKALGTTEPGKAAPVLEAQDIAFLVQGARAGAALAVARNQILTGRRPGIGPLNDAKGMKEFVEQITTGTAPIEGDRADGDAPPTRDEIEDALAEVAAADIAAQAYGPELPDEDAIPARAPQVIEMVPGPPDSGPGVPGQAGDTPAAGYVYKPPPLRLVRQNG